MFTVCINMYVHVRCACDYDCIHVWNVCMSVRMFRDPMVLSHLLWRGLYGLHGLLHRCRIIVVVINDVLGGSGGGGGRARGGGGRLPLLGRRRLLQRVVVVVVVHRRRCGRAGPLWPAASSGPPSSSRPGSPASPSSGPPAPPSPGPPPQWTPCGGCRGGGRCGSRLLGVVGVVGVVVVLVVVVVVVLCGPLLEGPLTARLLSSRPSLVERLVPVTQPGERTDHYAGLGYWNVSNTDVGPGVKVMMQVKVAKCATSESIMER